MAINNRYQVTPEEAARMVRCYVEQQLAIAVIAKRFSRSPNSVVRVLKTEGIEIVRSAPGMAAVDGRRVPCQKGRIGV